MATACFQLKHQSASFEYFLWLVLVQAMGATKIVIDLDGMKLKWFPRKVTLARVNNILLPGAAFAGLCVKTGKYSPDMITARAPDLLTWVRSGKSFQRLRSVKPPGKARYTVTIRRHSLAPARNSNEVSWRAFADEIGAVVVEDYDTQPIDLHDRVALYAGAEMNYGVCNGPMGLLALTEYPMMMFAPKGSAQNSMVKNGVGWGENYPWMLSNQRTMWRQDELGELRACHQHLVVGR